MIKFYYLGWSIILSLFFVEDVQAQLIISGTVYDITKKNPIALVSVLTASGKGTITDSLGRYSLYVSENDSIYFSYLNKPTPKYPVRSIQTPDNFDISILIKGNELPTVTVRQRNYLFDSVQNRETYAKIFNFQKPGIRSSLNNIPGAVSVGADLTELINIFRFRKNRRTLSFQQRLLTEEREKYLDHRYSRSLVKKLTGFSGPDLDSFMIQFRPTYDLTIQMNELEFGHLIIQASKAYKAGRRSKGRLLNYRD